MQNSDIALLRRWCDKRDAEAFQELVRRYAGMVYGVSRRVLGNDHDAEDTAQECFARLLGDDERLPRRSFAGWLHTCATRRAIDRLRSDSSRRQRERRYAEERPQSEEADWNDIRDMVDEAIAALPDRLREPLVLHFLAGKTHREVADLTGVPRATVSRRISQGVEQTRKALRSKGVATTAGPLVGLLAANAAEAAPAALVTELGKMAVAGAAAPATTAGALGGTGTAATGFLSLKVVGITMGLLAVVGGTAFLATRTGSKPVLLAETAVPQAQEANLAQAQKVEVAQGVPEERDRANATETKEPHTSTSVNGSIEGDFLDSRGNPIPSGRVSARSLEGEIRQQVWTYAEGHFEFKAIAPGRYLISAHPLDNEPAACAPVEVEVVAGAITRDVRLTYAGEVVAIPGSVSDTRGQPTSRARVRLDVKGGRGGFYTRADEDGRFVAILSHDALYEARARTEGFAASPPMAVRLDTRSIDFVLEDAGYLRVRVIHAETGEPIPAFQADAKIEVRNENGVVVSSYERERQNVSDPDGWFFTEINAVSDYTVTVRASGFQEATETFRDLNPAQGTVDAVFALTPADACTVLVTDQDGNPVRRTLVFRGPCQSDYRYEERALKKSTFLGETDARGTFQLDVLPAESAEFTFVHEAFAPVSTEIPPLSDRPESISVVLQRGCTIGGVVLRGAEPLAGYTVYASGRGSIRVSRKAITDSDGRFRMGTLPEGYVDLSLKQRGAIPGFTKPLQLEPNETRREDLILDGRASLEGRVKVAGGTPGEISIGVRCGGEETPEPRYFMGSLRADGAYRLECLKPGEAELHVGLCGSCYRYLRIPMTLANGRTTRQNVDFVEGSAALEGAIDIGDRAIRTAAFSLHVETTTGREDIGDTGFTPSKGYYRAEGLPPGNAVLHVNFRTREETFRRSYTFTLEPGRTVRQDVGVGSARIEGAVSGADSGFVVFLLPAGSLLPPYDELLSAKSRELPLVAHVRGDAQGRFSIEPLEGGAYELVALTQERSGDNAAPGPTRWTTLTVTLKPNETREVTLHIP